MDTNRTWELKQMKEERKETNYIKLISAICRNVGTPIQLDTTPTHRATDNYIKECSREAQKN